MSSQANYIMGPFADMLLQQAKFPSSDESRLIALDQACGSGVVSSHIMSQLSPDDKPRLDLTCADLSEAMIASMATRIEVSGWSNARAVKADAMDTKFPSSHFTHIFFNFGPQILSNPLAGLKECHRILQPGGILSFSVWQKVPWFADYRAGIATNPSLPEFPSDEQLRHAFSDRPERWDDVGNVKAHLRDCGFGNFVVRVVENTTMMEVAEVEAMLPFSLDMMIQRFWTKVEVEKYMEPARKAIVNFLEQRYGPGPVEWKWIAIIATGQKVDL